jgi:hypothetical protein
MMIDDFVSYHVHFPFCLFVYVFYYKKDETLYSFFFKPNKITLKNLDGLLKVLSIELKRFVYRILKPSNNIHL